MPCYDSQDQTIGAVTDDERTVNLNTYGIRATNEGIARAVACELGHLLLERLSEDGKGRTRLRGEISPMAGKWLSLHMESDRVLAAREAGRASRMGSITTEMRARNARRIRGFRDALSPRGKIEYVQGTSRHERNIEAGRDPEDDGPDVEALSKEMDRTCRHCEGPLRSHLAEDPHRPDASRCMCKSPLSRCVCPGFEAKGAPPEITGPPVCGLCGKIESEHFPAAKGALTATSCHRFEAM